MTSSIKIRIIIISLKRISRYSFIKEGNDGCFFVRRLYDENNEIKYDEKWRFSSYAWFTMNKDVQVKNMQVKAKAEGGLLINEVDTVGDANWDDEATANALPGTALLPTSTTNGAAWFHANSKSAHDEAGATLNNKDANISSNGYSALSLKASTTTATSGTKAENSVYYVDEDNDDTFDANENAYYVKYRYYMKVSSDTKLTLGTSSGEQNVAIKEVKVTLPGTPTSANLDKSLRVGIAMGDKMYIYAPVYGTGATSDTYYACTSVTGTGTTQTIANSAVLPYATNEKTNTALAELPKMTDPGTPVDVYVWFEGEDDFCQSDMITATLDDISVDITFSLETLSANVATVTTNNFDIPTTP